MARPGPSPERQKANSAFRCVSARQLALQRQRHRAQDQPAGGGAGVEHADRARCFGTTRALLSVDHADADKQRAILAGLVATWLGRNLSDGALSLRRARLPLPARPLCPAPPASR